VRHKNVIVPNSHRRVHSQLNSENAVPLKHRLSTRFDRKRFLEDSLGQARHLEEQKSKGEPSKGNQQMYRRRIRRRADRQAQTNN